MYKNSSYLLAEDIVPVGTIVVIGVCIIAFHVWSWTKNEGGFRNQNDSK